MDLTNNLSVLWTLLVRDASVFKKKTISRMIDGAIWGITALTVYGFIMPALGVEAGYGPFMLIGCVAVWGLFEMLSDTAVILADIAGHKGITYFLTLLIPQKLIFIRLGLFNAYKSFITPLPIFVVGKLVLRDQLPLAQIQFGKAIFFYFLFNLFYGFFGLFLASISKDVAAIATIRTRYLFPLWFLAGFNFPWKVCFNVLPKVAYLNLLNPLMYIIEGFRSTILDPADYLPFGIVLLF